MNNNGFLRRLRKYWFLYAFLFSIGAAGISWVIARMVNETVFARQIDSLSDNQAAQGEKIDSLERRYHNLDKRESLVEKDVAEIKATTNEIRKDVSEQRSWIFDIWKEIVK